MKENPETQNRAPVAGLAVDVCSAIVCPGCGWTGGIAGLTEHGACPKCAYENGAEPFRLLTVDELLADENGEYSSVNMGRFLRAIAPFLSPNT